MNYQDFIRRKRHSIGDSGIDPAWTPPSAFDFQAHIIERALRKGRVGVFLDTGLGKTMIQLAVAENIIRQTNGRVLILTPLAVAFQFLLEAERIGVHDIEHTKDGKHSKKIILCNYERLHLLSADDFVCVMQTKSSAESR